MRWPQGSCQELDLSLVSGLISVIEYLKYHFHKISLGALRAILYLFKFFLEYQGRIGK
jgi:hypothetical protein